MEYSKHNALEVFADPDLFRQKIGDKSIVLKDIDFLEERHSNLQIRNTKFINCSFTRCVFLGNEWHNVIFEKCTFLDTMIGENSTLEVLMNECHFSATEMDRCYVAGKSGYVKLENCICKGQKADAVNDAFIGFGSNGPTKVKGGNYYKTAFESNIEVLIEDATLESVGTTTDGAPGSKVNLIRCKGDQVGTGSADECLWQECNFKYSTLNGKIKNCVFDKVSTCLYAWNSNMGAFKATHCKFTTTEKTQYGTISFAAFFPRTMDSLSINNSEFTKGDLLLEGFDEDPGPVRPMKMQRANVTSIFLNRSSFEKIDIKLQNSGSMVMNDVRTSNLSITNGIIKNWKINNLRIDKILDTTGTEVGEMQANDVTKGPDCKTINVRSNVVL